MSHFGTGSSLFIVRSGKIFVLEGKNVVLAGKYDKQTALNALKN